MSQGIRSQELEHATQTSLYSRYGPTALGTNGNWYLAGHFQQSTWSFPYFIREMGPDGLILNEWFYGAPPDTSINVNDIVARPDGTLLLIGTKGVCDVWGPAGLIYTFDNGDIHSQRIYPSLGLSHSAANDSMLVIAATTGLLFTDLFGDSLNWTQFPPSELPARVCTTEEGFVGMGYFGARSVLPDGTFSDALLNVSVHDMIQLQGGSLLALTTDSLIELTSSLQRTGTGVRIIDNVGPRRVAYAGGTVRVHTMDTLYSFTPQLVQLGAIPTHNPWEPSFVWSPIAGYWPGTVEFADTIVMTAGAYISGSSAAACRSFVFDAPAPQLVTDAEMKDLTVDSLTYTLNYDPNFFSSASGWAWVTAWLHNSGDAPLTSVTLNHRLGAICGLDGYSQSYDTLALVPGDSIQLEFGPFYFYESFWQANTIDDLALCIWVARPNFRIDREPLGNEVCTSVSIDFTTGTFSSSGTTLPAIFPNPTKDQVMIRPDLPQHGSFGVTFFDLQGRAVLRRSMIYVGGSMRIEIEDLRPGVYIVEITQADHRASHRLVVD